MHLHTCLPYCMFCISPQCWLYPDLKSIMHYADDTFKFGFDMVWVLYVCLFTTFNCSTNSVSICEDYNYIQQFSGVLDGML